MVTKLQFQLQLQSILVVTRRLTPDNRAFVIMELSRIHFLIVIVLTLGISFVLSEVPNVSEIFDNSCGSCSAANPSNKIKFSPNLSTLKLVQVVSKKKSNTTKPSVFI